MKYPPSIQSLIDYFSRLPSVGLKTAERYVLFLLKESPEELQKFAQKIAELKEKTLICQTCFSYAETNPCLICADQKRERSVICVVANTQDMLAVEATNQYNGVYHILNGTLNSIEGIKPEQLNINNLLDKIKNNNIKEIILALNPDFEGETTSIYLTKLLKASWPDGIKISRLAKGLPTGANLEYADQMTLSNALKYRNEM